MQAGFEHTPILSYSTKYASAFYGPFRDAAQGAPKFGDRRSHQMDPANVREALRETALDVAEGADMLMVKPALAYLDVIRAVHEQYPGAAPGGLQRQRRICHGQGRGANGWLDEERATLEILTGIRRAGADLIITYHAKDAARWLQGSLSMQPLNSHPSHLQRFLNACQQQPVDCTPVWFMRQAGRYMSEYRAIRANHTLLEICAQPELAAEVTLQPVNALGVDAAILFADILLPLVPMGIQLEFAAGEGPVIHNPIHCAADVHALREQSNRASRWRSVMQALRMVRRELDGKAALIGFAGAPFTLASYIIEGGASRNYLKTKRLMYSDPQTWHLLMGKLARVIARLPERPGGSRGAGGAVV